MQTLVVIFGMIDENQVAWFYFMDLIDTSSHSFCIASKLSTNQIGYPFNRNRSRKFHNRLIFAKVTHDQHTDGVLFLSVSCFMIYYDRLLTFPMIFLPKSKL